MDIKDREYARWISEIKQRYKNAQIKASIRVNEELLRFYYRLGEEIAKSGYEAKYGAGIFYKKLSEDLRREIPDAKGFSVTCLHYMRWFYERYSALDKLRNEMLSECSENEIVAYHLDNRIDGISEERIGAFIETVLIHKTSDETSEKGILRQLAVKFAADKISSLLSPLKSDDPSANENDISLAPPFLKGTVVRPIVRTMQINRKAVVQCVVDAIEEQRLRIMRVPWAHHQVILGKCHSLDESLYYVNEAIANSWSRAVLSNFIKSDLFSRQGKAISNFASVLPKQESDLAQALTRDPYVFNFLTIDKRYKEKNLKDVLIDNVENFLLELGNGFAFLGKEKRIEVGEKEKFLDMLFYNMNLHCYVVVEIKVEEFDSENLGQIGLYVSEVDRQFRKEGDNPTIGLLIVASKDELFAKYALNMVSVPIGIAEYKLTNLLPDELKDELPSIEEIEKGIR